MSSAARFAIICAARPGRGWRSENSTTARSRTAALRLIWSSPAAAAGRSQRPSGVARSPASSPARNAPVAGSAVSRLAEALTRPASGVRPG